MKLQPLVEYIVKSIVSEPDAVVVEERGEREGTIFLVTVAPNDVGKIIGKNGRVITSVRQFVSACAAKSRRRAMVKVNAD